MSYRVSHSADWKEVSFSFVPGFVAKTQDQSSFDPRFENFTVPALPKSSSSPNGRLLCPVRAVKRYLDRTSQYRPRCKRLLVTSGCTYKEICNLTFPEYLISTLPHPCRTHRHTHRQRKRKKLPQQPFQLSPVVKLITPLVILPGSTAPYSSNSSILISAS